MKGTELADWCQFRIHLLDCQVLNLAYRRLDLLEGNFTEELAKRLPNYAIHRYIDFLRRRNNTTQAQTLTVCCALSVRKTVRNIRTLWISSWVKIIKIRKIHMT